MLSPVNRERCDEEKETIDTDYSKATNEGWTKPSIEKKEGSSADSFVFDC
jgi:hypothetical protein